MSWLFEEEDEDYIITMTKCGQKDEVIAYETWNITSGRLPMKKLQRWYNFNKVNRFRKLPECRAEVPCGSIQGQYKYKVTDGKRHFVCDSLSAGIGAETCILLVKAAIGETETRDNE